MSDAPQQAEATPDGKARERFAATQPPSSLDRRILQAASAIGPGAGGAASGSRLLAALCDPRTDADQVSAIIRVEPTLYARVLRVANCAFYRRAGTVSTLERAVVVLGFDAVRKIAASACLNHSFRRGHPGAAVDARSVLDHSLTTAIAAESLAKMIDPAMSSESFIGGLLHNFGVAVQLQMDAAGVLAMSQRRRSGDGRLIRQLESDCVSVGHEACAGVVFESWNLPESLIAAARNHHDPKGAPPTHRKLASVVCLASHLALASGSTFDLEPVADDCNSFALEELHLEPGALQELTATLQERADPLKRALLDA